MSAAIRVYPIPVMTKYGKAGLLGYDGKGQACVQFEPGAAPELELEHWRGGPCYTLFIPESEIEREA